MPNFKKIVKTAKIIAGIGNVKKPPDWPVNGFKEELKNAGGFKDSFVSASTGKENRALALFMNSKIVDARDQQILQYLKSKGIVLVKFHKSHGLLAKENKRSAN